MPSGSASGSSSFEKVASLHTALTLTADSNPNTYTHTLQSPSPKTFSTDGIVQTETTSLITISPPRRLRGRISNMQRDSCLSSYVHFQHIHSYGNYLVLYHSCACALAPNQHHRDCPYQEISQMWIITLWPNITVPHNARTCLSE